MIVRALIVTIFFKYIVFHIEEKVRRANHKKCMHAYECICNYRNSKKMLDMYIYIYMHIMH